MRTFTWLMLGLALVATTTDASAQEIPKSTSRPGYIGLRFTEQTHVSADETDKSRSSSAVVVRAVSKDSPAEKAGVRAGDEIVRINGMSAANGKFTALAHALTEGDTVRLRVKRDNSERDYTIVAAARPAGYQTMPGTIVFSADSVRGLMRILLDSARIHLDALKLPRILVHPGDSIVDIQIERFGDMPFDTLVFRNDTAALRALHGRVRIAPDGEIFRRFEGDLGPGVVFRSVELGARSIAGAEFTELDPGMKTYFGTDRGLLTLRVAAETPAARAGLLPGDVLLKANGRDVTTVSALRNLLFEDAATLKLEILRKGAPRTLQIQARRD